MPLFLAAICNYPDVAMSRCREFHRQWTEKGGWSSNATVPIYSKYSEIDPICCLFGTEISRFDNA